MKKIYTQGMTLLSIMAGALIVLYICFMLMDFEYRGTVSYMLCNVNVILVLYQVKLVSKINQELSGPNKVLILLGVIIIGLQIKNLISIFL